MRPVGFLLMIITPAIAHEKWANGDPVPAWVKGECCGQAEAHQLAFDQVHITARGYRIDGFPNPIPFSEARTSQDGQY
jgi:hypothetical protein